MSPRFTWPSAVTQPPGAFVPGADNNTIFFLRPDSSLTTDAAGGHLTLTNTGGVTQDSSVTINGLATAKFTAHTQSLYCSTGGVTGNASLTMYCVARIDAINAGLVDNFQSMGSCTGVDGASVGNAGHNNGSPAVFWVSDQSTAGPTADNNFHLFTCAYESGSHTLLARIDGQTYNFNAITALNLGAGFGLLGYFGSPYTAVGHVGPCLWRAGVDSYPLMMMHEQALMSLCGITPRAAADTIYVMGNSRSTTGEGGQTQWDDAMMSVLAAASITPTKVNNGVAGTAVGDAILWTPNVSTGEVAFNTSVYCLPWVNTGGSRSTLMMADMVNDITINYASGINMATAEQAWARLVAYAANFPRAANSKLVLFTVLGENTQSPGWASQQIPRFNAMLRAWWPSICDAIVDSAALPLGAPGSSPNWADGEHLSTAGNAIVGAAAAAVYRAIWGL